MLLLKTTNGIVGSLTASWTYYAKEKNTTILFCEKRILSIGTDPSFGVIVNIRVGHESAMSLELCKPIYQDNSLTQILFIISMTEFGYSALQVILATTQSEELKKLSILQCGFVDTNK